MKGKTEESLPLYKTPSPWASPEPLPDPHSPTVTEMAIKEVQGLYASVHDNPYAKGDAERAQKLAYRKLMNHLDDIEMRTRHWGKYIRRAAELFLFSGLVSLLVVSLSVEPTNHKRILNLRIWQWATMALMITAIFSVVPFATWILSFPLMIIFRTHKYWVYYLRRMKRSVDFTLWSCLVLSGWYMWFRPRLKHVYGDVSIIVCQQVTRLLIALCIGFLLWTFKRALYLKLEADLHYDQLFDRIKQTIIFLNGLTILEKRPPSKRPEFLTYDEDALDDYSASCKKVMMAIKKEARRKWRNWCRRFKTNGGRQQTDVQHEVEDDHSAAPGKCCTNIWMDVRKMKRESVPIWILVRLSKEYLKAVKSIRPSNADELINDDEKLLEMAREMFRKITGSTKQHIDQFFGEIKEEHLKGYNLSGQELKYLFRKKRHEEQAYDKYIHQQAEMNNTQQATLHTPQPQHKTIGVDEFLQWAVRVHKNCWGLERTLTSSKIAFVKLNRMLSTFLLVVVAIIWLLLSQIVNTGQVALLFAPFLAASFMFENSSKNLFQGIIFAFAMHPFDVGDRVIIENIQMRVKTVHILTSVFYKYDTGADVIFPNSKLATTKIVNLDITPDQSDTLDFIISSETPLENIKDLELTIERLLDDDIYYSTGTKVVKNSVQNPANPLELKMTVHYKYLVSYLTADKKAGRKSEILSNIMRFCKEMEKVDNKKDYSLCIPYDIELTTNKKAMTLLGIHRMKHEILERAKKEYEHAKIVLTHVEDYKIKMCLYTEKKKDVGDGSRTPKRDDSLFQGFETLLSEYGYTNQLKVVLGEEIIYDSYRIFKPALNKAMGKGKEVASSSATSPIEEDNSQLL